MSVARFGFGLNSSGAYHYLEVAGERLEAPVTPKLAQVLDVISYSDRFIIFSCDWRDEEYGDFHELAEVTGCLDKWEPILETVTEVIVVNE